MLMHSKRTEERDGQAAEPWRSEWSEVHRRLREYARQRAALDAVEAFDLVRHHRCTVPGCRSARNLDIHHIVPQAHGGKHELWNLTLLCSGHHAALHDGLLELHGQAPYDIEIRWVYGPPLPLGLDPEAREALILERIAQIFERMPPLASASRMDTSPSRDGAAGSTRG